MNLPEFNISSWPLEKQLTYHQGTKALDEASVEECRKLARQFLGLWLETQVVTGKMLKQELEGSRPLGSKGCCGSVGPKAPEGGVSGPPEHFMGPAGPDDTSF